MTLTALAYEGPRDGLRRYRPSRDGTLLHALPEAADAPRVAAAVAGLAASGAFAQVVADASPDGDGAAALAEFSDRVDVRPLAVPAGSPARRLAALLGGFAALLAEQAPVAVVVHGEDDASVACALAAGRRGVPVLAVRPGHTAPATPLAYKAILDRLAELHLVRDAAAREALAAAHVPEERIQVIGSPLVDAVRRRARQASALAAWRDAAVSPGTYVLAVLTRPEAAPGLSAPLARLAARTPVRLHLSPAVATAWQESGAPLPPQLCLPPCGFVERLSLERAAGAVITDSPAIWEEATALGVGCHLLAPGTDPRALLFVRPRARKRRCPPPARCGTAARERGSRPRSLRGSPACRRLRRSPTRRGGPGPARRPWPARARRRRAARGSECCQASTSRTRAGRSRPSRRGARDRRAARPAWAPSASAVARRA